MPYSRKNYPPDWEKISKRIRFERAGNCCEHCGAENYQPHPITGGKVCLTVAHLNHDTHDNREENLAALCNRCHLIYDAALHATNSRETRRSRKDAHRPLFALLNDKSR